MNRPRLSGPAFTLAPAVRRLNALAPLAESARGAIEAALQQTVSIPIRRDLLTEGKPTGAPRIIVQGWAARVRIQVDGRRQFLSFLLPGDLIGLCAHPDPLATSTVTALTPLKVCPAPAAETCPTLATAYAMSAATEEAYLLDQIARLGRLHALERILSLLLEFDERLDLAGLAHGGTFEIPLTQEQMADALGLTSVHVNRMLQQARREAKLQWTGRSVTIHDPALLAKQIGRAPVRVSAGI